MSGLVLHLKAPDAAAFRPFGRLVTPPAEAGQRAFYSESLHDHPEASAPVLHVNTVMPSDLPLTVDTVERHPFAAQCFFPLDVDRYVTLVMPSDPSGAPRPDQAVGFVVPGTLGIIYNPGVWHLGATVLNRPGHFAVLMWRGGKQEDDVFRAVPPVTLTL